MLEEAMAMEPARQDSPWDLGVRTERAKAEEQDMQAFFKIRETGTHAVLASMRDASLGQAESADLARSLSYTLMKMGYARTRVYVNGATAPGASAPSASTISRKDMSHGD